MVSEHAALLAVEKKKSRPTTVKDFPNHIKMPTVPVSGDPHHTTPSQHQCLLYRDELAHCGCRVPTLNMLLPVTMTALYPLM